MVIIRVGLDNRANRLTSWRPVEHTTTNNNVTGDRRSKTQVHTMTLVENNVDDDQRSPMGPRTSMIIESNRRSEITFDVVVEMV